MEFDAGVKQRREDAKQFAEIYAMLGRGVSNGDFGTVQILVGVQQIHRQAKFLHFAFGYGEGLFVLF